ncbi:N-formylglutamate amidohydrolase [Marivibrio halodurans]|uniref:N-formylglutamate amidohydrolase n=1 Tax=Marivibrio halodurans TaxID=2039722 RepID=A0A8J7V302_9PROT|nr:N-formylglutamate amidohydrolase [Marivibrio halodurans]MBP5857880.1 N-formylglutamate amidohydrolase [Marivibrio halodurans]
MCDGDPPQDRESAQTGYAARVDGLDGVYRLAAAVPDAVVAPVVLDSPHSGACYPADFRPSVPMRDLRRVEDAFVDELFADAPAYGAVLLAAEFPRSFIDPNRAADDIDPGMIEGIWPGRIAPTEKSRLGHGLIWRSYPSERPMYDGKLPVAEVARRIEGYWRPYHDALQGELERAYAAFGAVWHINCHSMPASSSPAVAGRPGARADFVLGDRDGTSCASGFTELVRDWLVDMGYSVRLNDPYRGAELVRAYGRPAQDRHSLQIEINRSLYMREATVEKVPGFTTLRRDLGRLVQAVCDHALYQTRRIAAE